MITLDQVQKLEKKVNDAVDLINRFKAEKVVLEERIEKYEFRILELEDFTEQLNKDQTEIEDKIIGALNQLEDLDSVPAETSKVEESSENVKLQDEETSADSSVSEEDVIVNTDEEESDDSVENSEEIVEAEAGYEDESGTPEVADDEITVDAEMETDAALSENRENNHSELQESITEDSQDGIPVDETVEEEEVPTVDSEFGEMPEDKSAKEDNSGADLFEQSLDIF